MDSKVKYTGWAFGCVYVALVAAFAYSAYQGSTVAVIILPVVLVVVALYHAKVRGEWYDRNPLTPKKSAQKSEGEDLQGTATKD